MSSEEPSQPPGPEKPSDPSRSAGSGKPAGRRRRGIAVAAGLVFLVVLIAMASALLFREELAETALRDQLIKLGFENPRFQVEELTADTVTINNFTAGAALSFDRLSITYSASDVLRGRVEKIDLTGLQVDTTQPGPWAGLQSESGGGSDRRVALALDPSVLPIIHIRQARILIAGPIGPMTIAAAVHLQPDPNGAFTLQATASNSGPPGKIELGYEGSIRVTQSGGATAAGLLSATSLDLTAGKVAVKSLKIELPLKIDTTADGKFVAVSESARFEINRFDLGSELRIGPLSGSLIERLTSDLSSSGRFDATADIDMDAQNIRAGDLSAKRFTAALSMRMEAGSGAATLEIARGGQLAIDGLRTTRNAPDTKLSTLLSGEIEILWPREGDDTGLSIDHKLSIVPAPAILPGSPDTHVILGKVESVGHLTSDSGYQGTIAMDTGRLTRGAQSVAITSLLTRLTAGTSQARPRAQINVGGLRDLSEVPVSGSYDLAATIRQTSKGLNYRATIGGLGIKRLATIVGSHDLTARSGHADVSIPVIALGSEGVEPASVIPALKKIRNVAGKLAAKATLNWSDQGLNGRGSLQLDRVGGETEDAALEGLSGTIVFNSLRPLATAPAQRLRIKTITAGTVLTDTSIRFALLPEGILRVDRAEASLADGKVIIKAPAIDPVAQDARATVTFQDVQLEKLLSLVDLGDLRASGRIHGFVPIRISGGKIAIKAGALASLGGGTLQFKSERANQVLKSGGDQVALMLQALENFSYERLGVDIDKSIAGNARVTLRTLGHNPAVLRGRKFQINVNLETNLDRLLDAAMQWYRLSGKAWRDIVAHGKRQRNSKQ